MASLRGPLVIALAAAGMLGSSAHAQVLDRIRDRVTDAKSVVTDARELRCEVQGACGRVSKSELFTPEAYETLAVAVFDVTRRAGTPAMLAVARDAFESTILTRGYVLAAHTDAEKVRTRIGASRDAWTDERLAQLRDFIDGIDAVLVVDIRSVVMGTCPVRRDGRNVTGRQATLSLSARWLNTDVGDVPWVAVHEATVCQDRGSDLVAQALATASKQLATTIPQRRRAR